MNMKTENLERGGGR